MDFVFLLQDANLHGAQSQRRSRSNSGGAQMVTRKSPSCIPARPSNSAQELVRLTSGRRTVSLKTLRVPDSEKQFTMALVWSVRNHDEGTVQKAYGTLHEVAEALPSLIDQKDAD
jgi:hypothetical protein